MQNISPAEVEVNPQPPERELQIALYESIAYQVPGPVLRYLAQHPDRIEVASETLRVAAGASTMPRRKWMRTLAEQIEIEGEPIMSNLKTDTDCVTAPDLEIPFRIIRELDAEMIAGRFDLSDRQCRGQYRSALVALAQAVERRRSALGWVGSRLEAEKIDVADLEWKALADTKGWTSCPGCGNRMTRIRRRGADHDVFTCAFCDSGEVRADTPKEAMPA